MFGEIGVIAVNIRNGICFVNFTVDYRAGAAIVPTEHFITCLL
jgi:hypothetical protein